MMQVRNMIIFPITLLLLLTIIHDVKARCPDHCSGHGKCVIENHKHSTLPGGKFMCECWPGFVGLNCAGRDCPYGKALSDVPFGDNAAHQYEECSGRGLCDRKTGECVCYDGTEGQACGKLTCPNACSGHGKCETARAMAKYHSDIPYTYDQWDADMAVGCFCDPGYEGADCSLRSCPLGDDPLTNRTRDANSNINVEQKHEVQLLRLDGVTDVAGSYTLTYTDLQGREYTTRPISVQNNALTVQGRKVVAADLGTTGTFTMATYIQRTGETYCPFDSNHCEQQCDFGFGINVGDIYYVNAASQTTKHFTVTAATPCQITVTPDPVAANAEVATFTMVKGGKEAKLQGLIGKSGVKHGLMGLPNRIIDYVSVSEDARHNARKDFKVTFTHPDNSGDQKNLQCNTKGCDQDGCQPRYKGIYKSLGRIHLPCNSGSPGMRVYFYPPQYVYSMPTYTNPSLSSMIYIEHTNTAFKTVDTALLTYTVNPFKDILQPGDQIKFTGTSSNDNWYTVKTVDATGNRFYVNEDITWENTNVDLSMDIKRYFGAATQRFPITVDAGPTASTRNGVFLAGSSTEFTIQGEKDFFQPLRVGDEITIKTGGHADNNNYVGKRYEIESIETLLVIIQPDDTSVSAVSSTFDVVREAGACNVTEVTKGTREAMTCSGRGSCNHKSGECKCFDNYAGIACSEQQVLR